MRFGAVIVAAFLAVDPFGWDQVGPFRFALISALGFATIAASLGAGDARPQPLPRWATLGWSVVLVGMVISTALSPDLWHALIGTPERHFGLATWFLLSGLFFVASIYPNSIVPFTTNATIVGAIGAGVWSLLEAGNVGWFDSSFAGDRIGGPFQQPAYLGAAMVLAAPICLGVAVDPQRSRAARACGGIGGIGSIIALGLSQSRGAWLAFAIAAAATVVQRRMLRTGVVIAIAAGLLIALTPVGSRLGTLTNTEDGVVAGRIDEWQVGARAITDTPTLGVTGHGPEGYRTVFGQHVDDSYVIDHGRDVFTDRAHNVVLDTTLTGGFISGFGLLLLYGGLGVTAVRRLKAEDVIDVALAAAVLGSLLQQLVLFPLAEVDPALWIFAGLLVARRPSSGLYRPPLFRYVSQGRRVAMLGAGFLAAMSAVAGLSDVAADHATANAVTSDDPAVALVAAEQARSRRPDSIRYDFIASRIASQAGTLEGFASALQSLDDGLSISPKDPALRIERASVLLEIARRTGAADDLATALANLEELADAEPRHPQVLMHLGIARALNGQPSEAANALVRSAELNPTNVEPLINLAVVYFESGDLDQGEEILARIDQLAPSNTQAETLRREFLSE